MRGSWRRPEGLHSGAARIVVDRSRGFWFLRAKCLSAECCHRWGEAAASINQEDDGCPELRDDGCPLYPVLGYPS